MLANIWENGFRLLNSRSFLHEPDNKLRTSGERDWCHSISRYNSIYDIQVHYNTIIPSPLSAERDNSRQLAGGNARARNSEGIICYNTFRFRLEGV